MQFALHLRQRLIEAQRISIGLSSILPLSPRVFNSDRKKIGPVNKTEISDFFIFVVLNLFLIIFFLKKINLGRIGPHPLHTPWPHLPPRHALWAEHPRRSPRC